MGAALAGRERRLQRLQRQLGGFDVGRRLALIRTQLVEARGKLSGSIDHRTHRARAQLTSAAARLEALSPLAVLARGYAVCWSADRMRALRSASEVRPGDAVHVTLADGALECDVRGTSAEAPAASRPPRREP